jgi:CDP-paratose 2-epimerase
LKALVTGGIGFIGSNLSRRLLSGGHDVIALDSVRREGVRQNLHWLQSLGGDHFRFVEGDVRDFETVQKAMRDVSVVFHLAAQVAVTTSLTDPRDDFTTNALGTFNVLEAARQLKPLPAVLYTSTNKVYGEIEHVRIAERDTRYVFENLPYGVPESCPLDFYSPYGCSKGAADQYVRDCHRIFGLPTVVLRMSCIYGPRQFGNEDQGWVAHFALTTMRGGRLTIYGDGKQVRDILYVDDLVDLMLVAVQNINRTAGQVYNVGGGPANTISVWAEFRELLAKRSGRLPSVSFDQTRFGDQKVYITDIRKLREQLNWAPKVGVEEGVRRLIEEWCVELVAAAAS